jgi:hypothetical protein
MEAERRENGLLSTSKRASTIVSVTCIVDVICIQIYPTSADARVATTIGRVEGLCRLGGRWCCADLDVAAGDAIKERLLLRAVATCCADRVEHRTAHYYYERWSWRIGDLSTCVDFHVKLEFVKSKARNAARPSGEQHQIVAASHLRPSTISPWQNRTP